LDVEDRADLADSEDEDERQRLDARFAPGLVSDDEEDVEPLGLPLMVDPDYQLSPRSYAAYWRVIAASGLKLRFNYTPYQCKVHPVR
jgi:hypothetical protein